MENKELIIATEIEEKIKDINTKALDEEVSKTEIDTLINELKELEGDYRKMHEKAVFSSLPDVEAAIRMHSFSTISHKNVNVDGIFTGVERAEKIITLDLKRFCDFKGADTKWYWNALALKKRFTLRIGVELGYTTGQIKQLDDSYKMADLAKDISLGKTPLSNSQMVAHLNEVLHSLVPTCGNCTNCDKNYVMLAYSKRGKSGLKLLCSNDRAYMELLYDVFHKVVTSKSYSLEDKAIVVEEATTPDENKPDASSEPNKENNAA